MILKVSYLYSSGIFLLRWMDMWREREVRHVVMQSFNGLNLIAESNLGNAMKSIPIPVEFQLDCQSSF